MMEYVEGRRISEDGEEFLHILKSEKLKDVRFYVVKSRSDNLVNPELRDRQSLAQEGETVEAECDGLGAAREYVEERVQASGGK